MAMRELLRKVTGATLIGAYVDLKCCEWKQMYKQFKIWIWLFFNGGARGQRKVEATSLGLRWGFFIHWIQALNQIQHTMKQETWLLRHPNPFSWLHTSCRDQVHIFDTQTTTADLSPPSGMCRRNNDGEPPAPPLFITGVSTKQIVNQK